MIPIIVIEIVRAYIILMLMFVCHELGHFTVLVLKKIPYKFKRLTFSFNTTKAGYELVLKTGILFGLLPLLLYAINAAIFNQINWYHPLFIFIMSVLYVWGSWYDLKQLNSLRKIKDDN